MIFFYLCAFPAALPQFPYFLAAGGHVAKPGGRSPSRPQAPDAVQSGTASTAILNLSTRYRDNSDVRPLASFTKVIKLEHLLRDGGGGGSYLMWPFCSNCDLCMKKVGENIKRHFFGTENCVSLVAEQQESYFFPSLLSPPPLHAPKALMYTKENLCNHIKRSWGEYNQASFSITIRKLFCKTCGEAFDLYFYANAGVLPAPVGKRECRFVAVVFQLQVVDSILLSKTFDGISIPF